VDVNKAARRWARTWEEAWVEKDADAIAALYAQRATYRSHPMRDPEPGGAYGYVSRQFPLEEAIQCRSARR
jgi:hypothetical protein